MKLLLIISAVVCVVSISIIIYMVVKIEKHSNDYIRRHDDAYKHSINLNKEE